MFEFKTVIHKVHLKFGRHKPFFIGNEMRLKSRLWIALHTNVINRSSVSESHKTLLVTYAQVLCLLTCTDSDCTTSVWRADAVIAWVVECLSDIRVFSAKVTSLVGSAFWMLSKYNSSLIRITTARLYNSHFSILVNVTMNFGGNVKDCVGYRII